MDVHFDVETEEKRKDMKLLEIGTGSKSNVKLLVPKAVDADDEDDNPNDDDDDEEEDSEVLRWGQWTSGKGRTQKLLGTGEPAPLVMAVVQKSS